MLVVLLGEYRLSLDDKGRLSVPAAIRHALHELYAPDDQALVITKFFEHCLVMYPKPAWLERQKQLEAGNTEPFDSYLARYFAK